VEQDDVQGAVGAARIAKEGNTAEQHDEVHHTQPGRVQGWIRGLRGKKGRDAFAIQKVVVFYCTTLCDTNTHYSWPQPQAISISVALRHTQ
jgi:hypothetical protein